MSEDRTKENLIVESNEIRDVLKYCSFNTLGTFDLDNTLIRPTRVKGLASDKWFAEVFSYGSKVLTDANKARQLTIELCDLLQTVIQVKSVEDKTAIVLKVLKDVGLPIMGLTARGVNLSEITEAQLKSVGISFTTLSNEVIELDVGDPTRKPFYKNGIIYCDGANKGKCLSAFLAYLGVKYNIVMVDDTGRNLDQILAEANKVGFSFTGLRYGRTDQLLTKFSLFKSMEKMKDYEDKLPSRAHTIIQQLKLEQLNVLNEELQGCRMVK
ncbi:DUF2608 domain-containing protein [Legionella gresilensis]|uniref:DUF2608 domain-containing protein n=1 Tax=Legionella gresilensis TaxID=91823 RepID=UPI0010410381|nr:DUF2608 domain-containing protein [Legionella gresilensis]